MRRRVAWATVIVLAALMLAYALWPAPPIVYP